MAENPAPRRSLKEHVAAARALLSGPRVARVPAADALGRALAVDVAAAEDSPRFTNSQMDGYALREDQRGGGRFRVGPTIPAGADPKDVAPDPWAGDVVLPVMTGARLPEGTAAVVPVEPHLGDEDAAVLHVAQLLTSARSRRSRGRSCVRAGRPRPCARASAAARTAAP